MKLIPIFVLENQCLYAVKYNNDPADILTMLFDKWQDGVYLEEFFDDNLSDLTNGFYKDYSVEQAISRTSQDAQELEEQLFEIGAGEPGAKSLIKLFKPLEKISYKPDDYEKMKAYGVLEKSWIRLYAIKLPENCFIVTGGAIKLTHQMKERAHTKKELDNLKRCRDFLRSHGIIDDEGVEEISK
jgi:hypothetical protein